MGRWWTKRLIDSERLRHRCTISLRALIARKQGYACDGLPWRDDLPMMMMGDGIGDGDGDGVGDGDGGGDGDGVGDGDGDVAVGDGIGDPMVCLAIITLSLHSLHNLDDD